MKTVFKALSTEMVRSYQNGASDAHGQMPERVISDGTGNQCRHCLTEIPKGQDMLILSFMPFDEVNAYSEMGPIFLCGSECFRHPDSNELPDLFAHNNKMLIRGYSTDGKIVYGTGSVVNTTDIKKVAGQIFDDSKVSYIHLRSEGYNCYQCRIDRA